jgi:hypothetical protein
MKITMLTLTFLINGSLIADTKDLLRNCFQSRGAQFFVSDLEEIRTESNYPVLLLNSQNEVAGVIEVTPESDENGKVTRVEVQKVSLCSSLEVDVFYYTDDIAANLLDWTGGSEVEVSQDEGLLVLKAEEVKQKAGNSTYAKLYKASFKAYDVFTEEEEIQAQEGQLNFLEDWGVPKGTGIFFYYLPKEWLSKK